MIISMSPKNLDLRSISNNSPTKSIHAVLSRDYTDRIREQGLKMKIGTKVTKEYKHVIEMKKLNEIQKNLSKLNRLKVKTLNRLDTLSKETSKFSSGE